MRIENGRATAAYEVTSPPEAFRPRKIAQLERGDELIARPGSYVLGSQGERYLFNPGLRTTLRTAL